MVDFSVITFTLLTPSSRINSDRNSSSVRILNSPSATRTNQKRIVVKFGGSSLADKERISKAAKLIADEANKGTRLVVVVSAMGKMTDHLSSLIDQDSNETSDKMDMDDILAMGERTSVRVFSSALKREGLEAKYFDPSDPEWPIITDDQHSNANPLLALCLQKVNEHVKPLLDQAKIPVIAGFVGRSTTGKISTIGRGGSDTTAFIIAKGIGADEVVLVTDAEGILSADPKLIPNAKKLNRIDVSTLIGLADSGTKFIHRKALRYKDQEIPVRVINHRKDSLGAEGTVIIGSVGNEVEVALASDAPMISVTIAGKAISENPAIITALVDEIKNHSGLAGLSADFDSVIFYVPQDRSEGLLDKTHDIVIGHEETFAMAVQRDLAFLRIKGVGLEDTPGIIGKISTRLEENQINIFGILTLASSILVFVSWKEREEALSLMTQVVKGEGK